MGRIVEGTLELWARKAIEYSKLGELFCGSLEDKSVEGNVEDGSLACDVSEGRLETLIRTICYFELRFCRWDQLGLKSLSYG